MMALGLFHLVAGTALTGLAAQASLNHLLGERLERMPEAPSVPHISVLIPARNEAGRIGGCVAHWLGQEYPDFEVFVYDDDSSDDTAGKALAAASGARHVHVIRGGRLPEAWRGKSYACDRLRALARGDILVFADADVRPAPAALARTAGAFATLSVDAMSAVPSHTSASLAVRALVANQNWAASTFVPSWLCGSRPPVLLAAMNGQFFAIRAAVYDASGGFAAVRDALAEDVLLGRRLVTLGYRIRLLDGARVLGSEPYDSVRALWRANARNLLPVFFGSGTLLVLAMAMLAALYLGPLALVVTGAILGRAGTAAWTWLPVAEILIGLLPRLVADRRAGYPAWLSLCHPLAIAGLIGMGFDSVARFRWRGVVEWRGRRYRVTDHAS